MTITRSSRGTALVAAIVLAGLLALIGDALARICFERALIFNQQRDSHYARFVQESATRELQACGFGLTFSSAAACGNGWSPWTVQGGVVNPTSATTRKTYSLGGGDLKAVSITADATWYPDRIQVDVNFVPGK